MQGIGGIVGTGFDLISECIADYKYYKNEFLPQTENLALVGAKKYAKIEGISQNEARSRLAVKAAIDIAPIINYNNCSKIKILIHENRMLSQWSLDGLEITERGSAHEQFR